MTKTRTEQLVKMARQIALNLGAEGDGAADRTAAHIRKFWTPAMRQQLIDYCRESSEDVPSSVRQITEIIAEGE